jgi:hypothetical protein
MSVKRKNQELALNMRSVYLGLAYLLASMVSNAWMPMAAIKISDGPGRAPIYLPTDLCPSTTCASITLLSRCSFPLLVRISPFKERLRVTSVSFLM